jgi:hypothetical protein
MCAVYTAHLTLRGLIALMNSIRRTICETSCYGIFVANLKLFIKCKSQLTKQVPSSASDEKVSACLSFYLCVISLELSLKEFVMAEERTILVSDFCTTKQLLSTTVL